MVCATALVEYLDQRQSPSLVHIDMAITVLPSDIGTPIASHINLLEVAKAKSLTLSALKTHVLVLLLLDFIRSSASSYVAMVTGCT